MDPLLMSQLAVMIGTDMQGNVGICDIMAHFSCIFENGLFIFLPECFREAAHHDLYPPGNNTIDPEGIG